MSLAVKKAFFAKRSACLKHSFLSTGDPPKYIHYLKLKGNTLK